MHPLVLLTLGCALLVQDVQGSGFGRTTVAECPLVSTLLHTNRASEDHSTCMFTVLSLSAYIYRPSQEMNFMLLSTSRRQLAKYYNIEITDITGRPVGQFIKGDNVCRTRNMLTHSPKVQLEERKVPFTWRAPSTNLGKLFFRFSVGIENPDGSVSVWLSCDKQTSLTYFQAIPSPALYNIENQLSGHTNYRQGGATPTPPSPSQNHHQNTGNSGGYQGNYRPVGMPGPSRNPPTSQRVAHESSTPPTNDRTTHRQPSAPSPNPRVNPTSANYGSRPGFGISPIPPIGEMNMHIATDGASWCKPIGAPRFQIVPGTNCRRYTTYPNSNVFSCFPGLQFSVLNCGCTYRRMDTPCTYQ